MQTLCSKHLGVEEMLFVVQARNSEACHPAFSGYNTSDDVSCLALSPSCTCLPRVRSGTTLKTLGVGGRAGRGCMGPRQQRNKKLAKVAAKEKPI